MGKEMFIDPTPVSMDDVTTVSLAHSDMDTPSHVGGGIVVVAIVTCGGKLGSATVVTVGTAVTTVAA
jgi:hypothetical protein